MSATYYTHKGQDFRRFIDHVEVYPGKWGYRCTLMVFPKVVLYDVISRGFIHRNLHDYFKCYARNCGILHKCVTIRPVDKFIPSEQMKKMLNFLDEKQMTIRWKEGQFGYQIDKLGNIARTWELDEPAAEVIDVSEGAADQETEHSPTS